MFTCGTANFSHMDHDDGPPPPPPPTATKPSTSKKKHNKNPYAARGLDKFSMVLAELETRREKIMAKTGAQGVAMIKFMCDNSHDWVPIIVRPPKEVKAAELQVKQLPAPSSSSSSGKEEKKGEEKKKVEVKKRVVGWGSYYWPLVMVLILLCLVVFGRVFAICCTCVWWYMAPTMKERMKGLKRREIGRRSLLGDKRLASPRVHGIINGKSG